MEIPNWFLVAVAIALLAPLGMSVVALILFAIADILDARARR